MEKLVSWCQIFNYLFPDYRNHPPRVGGGGFFKISIPLDIKGLVKLCKHW